MRWGVIACEWMKSDFPIYSYVLEKLSGVVDITSSVRTITVAIASARQQVSSSEKVESEELGAERWLTVECSNTRKLSKLS